MPFTGTYKTNEDLGKVNPRRTIPSIDDNGLYLSERYMPINIYASSSCALCFI